MNITKEVQSALRIPVYLVGGSIRDILLNKEPKDWDFCTPELPDTIEKAIVDYGRKPYTVGKRFGTLGFKLVINDKINFVEVTTFRTEVYQNTRKPEVSFITNLREDLSRRDFTINALAQDYKGNIIDYFNGKDDLKNKIIRCVGTPKARFMEDPLRILRAVRFASVLGFTIEENTLKYMDKMKFELLRVSKERWVTELDKILVAEHVDIGLRYMQELGITRIIFPEVWAMHGYDQNSRYHNLDLWSHTLKVVTGVPNNNLNLKWVGLLHDIGKPTVAKKNKSGFTNYVGHELVGAEMALKICHYFKFSNERTEFIYNEIKNHLNENSPLKEYDDNAK